jgi:site-specific recombinase XerD
MLQNEQPRIVVPVIVANAVGRRRFCDFFTIRLRNAHTRRTYHHAVSDFLAWCTKAGVPSIDAVQPSQVTAWVEDQRGYAASTVRTRLAAIHHFFDWMVTGNIIPMNPAAAVRGPRVVEAVKTAALTPAEARTLLDSIDTTTLSGLRDRALLAVMMFSFARIGAALGMTVGDVFWLKRQLWLRLPEKGGKPHAMPCHDYLATVIIAYIKTARIADDRDGPLFRTFSRRRGRPLARKGLQQPEAYKMITRRAIAAGFTTRLSNHSFRATGITVYLNNGGTLEMAAQIANHASTRTTQLYAHRREKINLAEMARIKI